MVDKNAIIVGTVINRSSIKIITYQSNERYYITDYIPVDCFVDYYICRAKGALASHYNIVPLFNENKELIGAIDAIDIETDYSSNDAFWTKINITDLDCKYIRLSNHKDSPIYMGRVNEAFDPTNIPDYTENRNIKENVYIKAKQILGNTIDNLYNKVWYVIGDSATSGDSSLMAQELLSEGIYAGELPVYPFYIGNRTGMIVHNLAVSGSVLATITDQPTRYQWSVEGHYDTLVGSDADYITIWLGANDMWQKVPIGTIDSNDATTFYGAYNKVLTYYCNNFPNAKLGIVASFWCTEDYATAVIEIGKKYGVPVLNLYNDSSLPVTVGSRRPDVSDTIKTLRNKQWGITDTNTHPSAKYHEIVIL